MSSVSSGINFKHFQNEILQGVEDSFSGQNGAEIFKLQALEIANAALKPYANKPTLTSKDVTNISNQVFGDIDVLLNTAAKTQECATLRSRSRSRAPRSSKPVIQIEEHDEKKAAKKGPLNPENSQLVKEMYQSCFSSFNEGGESRGRELNGIIYQDTKSRIDAGKGYSLDTFKQMVDGTYYEPNPPAVPAKALRSHKTLYYCLNSSTFDAAAKMREDGLNPLVLDMANKRFVGGNPESFAQEEDLVRRSTLKFGLLKVSAGREQYHPPISKGGIYVPSVEVFRKGVEEGYAICKSFTCDVYALPAYDCNQQHRDGYDRPAHELDYQNGMKDKIRAMFREAYRNQNDSLLLGAWGCGSFANNPETVAQILIDVLAENEFKGLFKQVRFAIPARETLDIFIKQFGTNENQALLNHRKKSCCNNCILQ